MKKLIITFLLATLSYVSFGQSFNSNEEAYSVLIYSVSKYIEWESVSGDFDIVILNNPKIAEHMKKYYVNKKINGVNVKIVEDKNTRTDFTGVEMLISGRKSVVLENLLTFNLQDVNGIVNFAEENGKIKIKIKKSIADKSKLKISGQLISIVQLIE